MAGALTKSNQALAMHPTLSADFIKTSSVNGTPPGVPTWLAW
ncbi:MAG: hypothetical protein AB7L71_20380 [Vicinamibacterales bacterium]